MIRNRIAVLLLATLILASFAACSSVAVSGRKQLNIISDSEMMAMSVQQYDAVLQESQLSTDTQQVEMVQRVGHNIKDAVERYFKQINRSNDLQGYEWEFNLIESEDINAWAMPGGKVAFYTGILPVCKDETGVAVVMGHEVAHAVAEHGAERMSQALLVQMGGMALSSAVENEPEQTQALWMGAFGLGAQVGVMLPYSRTMESESDHLGLIFMAMAGYDPNAAVSFWERMAAQKGGAAPPEFLSTHPSDQTRIANIREKLPEALKHYQPQP
jgi:predicted Zn-dependent protease